MRALRSVPAPGSRSLLSTSCCALVVLLAVAAANAAPIVLQTTRHINPHAVRNVRDEEPETHNEPLTNDLETYALEISLGTPAKPYRVVIDTGTSSYALFPPRIGIARLF